MLESVSQMAKEKTVRRVPVPLQREDDDALLELAHLSLEEGQLIRAFWRIGLRHRDEFFDGGSAVSLLPGPVPMTGPTAGSARNAPPTELAARRRSKT